MIVVPLEMAEKGLAKVFGDVFSVAFEEMFASLPSLLSEMNGRELTGRTGEISEVLKAKSKTSWTR
jgi:hypothetical protein